MITCKEDLINTYIYDDGGELRDAYFSIAEKFGFLIDEGDYNLGIISVMEDCKYVQDINSLELVRKCKKLTLSDLKPRTKVEYEKAEFEPEEIWKAFKEHQEVGYLYVNTSDGFECLLDGVFNLAMAISQGDQLYRKVERPVEWFDDLSDFINSDSVTGKANYEDGKLIIGASFTHEQLCDLARIALEQEDENKNNASS